jgi:LDH2 family malate/lactate/ureidoglycolate dehydrogenase
MGGFMLVVNPRLAGDGYGADVQLWVDRYLRVSGEGARYPGERAAESEAERRRDGIPLPPVLLKQIEDTGARLGVPLAAA